MKTRTIIFGALFLASCILLLSCSSSSRTPEETVKALIHAMDRGTHAQAMALLSEENRMDEEAQDEESFKDTQKSLQNEGGVEKVEILGTTMRSDGSAEVEFRVTMGNGNTNQGSWNCVKEGGKWKVSL